MSSPLSLSMVELSAAQRKDSLQVLSLQECCLLYLITHVEEYSPQTLALLPKHLRQALLSSVAPLHLYQLDQTKVADGIDTICIWGDVFRHAAFVADENRVFSGNSAFKNDGVVVNPREVFINAVLQSLLRYSPRSSPHELCKSATESNATDIGGSIDKALSLELVLFGLPHASLSDEIVRYLKQGKRGLVNIEGKNCFISTEALSQTLKNAPHNSLSGETNDFQQLKPKEATKKKFKEGLFSDVSQRQCPAKECVSALVRAGASPSELVMDAGKVVSMGVWLPEEEEEEVGLIEPLLVSPKLTRVVIESLFNERLNATNSLLKAILSPSSSSSSSSTPSTYHNLQHLHINCPLDGSTLASLAPSLTAHGALKSLKMVLSDSKADRVILPLHSIISSQTALEVLEIRSSISRSGSDQRLDYSYAELCGDVSLVEDLSRLFRNARFSRLTLEGFTLPGGAIETIVSAFLESSPTSEKSSVTFSFLRVRTQTESHFSQDSSGGCNLNSSQNARQFGRKKHLSLQSVRVSSRFWQWFSALPCVCLGSLCVRNSQCAAEAAGLKKHPHFSIGQTVIY